MELPTLERSPERSVLESSSPVLDPIRYKWDGENQRLASDTNVIYFVSRIHLLLKELAANRELVLSLRSFMNVWRPPSTACRLHPDDKWASTVPNLHQFRAGYAWGTCSPQGVQPGFNTPAQKRAAHTSSTVESYTVPGLIRTLDDREIVTTALADYCAKYNFVSSEYATELMLPIDRCDTVNVTIGSSKIIQTLGTISTRFSFQGEDSFHDLTFHVLQDCLQKVVLGKPFLKASQTFSNAKNFAARIKRSVEKMVSRHHMFFLGESTPSFTGSVNGVHSRALADTGSNALVMDRAYARRNGIVIDPGPRSRLFFADGSQKYTRGIARGVKWRFGPGPDAEEHLLDFHILRNAPANIVLSDSFLFKTQAFSKYSDCLSDGEGQDEHGYLCLMTRDSTYNPKGVFQTELFFCPRTKLTRL